MPLDEHRAETSDAAGERQSLVRRVLALPKRMFAAARRAPLMFAVLLTGTGIILASGSSAAYYLVTHSATSERNLTIEATLALLDQGEYEQAKQMALLLRQKIAGDYSQLGHPLFIQGAVLAHEAAEIGHEKERQTLYLVAARYLEEARDRGFPAGREKQGLYLLATSLFNAAHFAESLPALHEASEIFEGEEFELARLLSTAYLRDSVPNLERAMHYNQIWLEDPALPPPERDTALLQLAEIALHFRDKERCHETLAKISDDSQIRDQALLLLARLYIQEGDDLLTGDGGDVDAAHSKYNQAIEVLGTAQIKDILGTTTRQSRYLLGICYQKLGDQRAAQDFFERTQRMHYSTPEALAATLAGAEIAQQQGQYDDALPLYLKVLEEAGAPSLYQNPWVPLRDLQARLNTGQQEFLQAQQYKSALAMANALDPIIPADQIAAAKADTHEKWASHLLASAQRSGQYPPRSDSGRSTTALPVGGEPIQQARRVTFCHVRVSRRFVEEWQLLLAWPELRTGNPKATRTPQQYTATPVAAGAGQLGRVSIGVRTKQFSHQRSERMY